MQTHIDDSPIPERFDGGTPNRGAVYVVSILGRKKMRLGSASRVERATHLLHRIESPPRASHESDFAIRLSWLVVATLL